MNSTSTITCIKILISILLYYAGWMLLDELFEKYNVKKLKYYYLYLILIIMVCVSMLYAIV